ncbi:MAG: uracil-DNA glycosylase family protein, partial [Bacteroidetes bacterium]|nr:uracil-DNA glycosylase family protein [Bacteroidota bacterium]
NFENYLPKFFPLPHPSTRNNIWLKKNPWFVKNLLPQLSSSITQIKKSR